MSIQVFSGAGTKSTASVKLPKVVVSDPAYAQTVHVALANEQRHRATTKRRGEVRGGGKKPWRQKGTGRARAGSSRSPLWRGGGITFGPIGQPRTLLHTNRHLANAALRRALTEHAEVNKLYVVTGKLDLAKSTVALKLLGKLGLPGTASFVVGDDEPDAVRGMRNLAGIDLHTVSSVRLSDLLRHGSIICSEAAYTALTGEPLKPARPPAAEEAA